MDCSSILEFENNLDMDENFDLVDSIISLLDYGDESYGYETLHNKIKININNICFIHIVFYIIDKHMK